MRLKLPKWLSQPSPSTPDAPALSTDKRIDQLEQRLAEADSEVTAAQAKSQELLVRFSESRTAENLETQELAESDLARLQKLRALVVANLEAARAKLAAEERAKLEQEIIGTEARIFDNSRANELVDEVVRACERLIEAQVARYEHANEVSNLRGHLHGLRVKLGHGSDYRWDPIDSIPPAYPIVDKLKATVERGAPSQVHGGLTYALANLLSHWR